MLRGQADTVRKAAVEDLLAPLRLGGRTAYAGEAVTVTEHSLQAATAAERDGASAALTVACLLHDIGWVLRGGPRPHEVRGSAFLAEFFGPAVTDPVRLHVLAKRYLCTVDGGYDSTLSPASRHTLRQQGGILDDAGLACLDAEPRANDAIRLRLYDDQAKVPDAETPDLGHFASLMTELFCR
jgi:predicted HD phosphohydrolase